MADDFVYKVSIDDNEALAAFGRIAKKAEQTAKEAKDALGKIELGQQAREIEKAFATIQQSGKFNIRQLTKEELELQKALELVGATGQFEFNKIRKETEKTVSTTDKLKSAFSKLSIAIGTLTALAVAVKKLTDEAIALEKANFNLAVSANAAAREFGTSVGTAESWRNTLSDIRKETKIYSDQELANASSRLIDMTKRLGLTQEEMQIVLKRTIDLSAGKVDLAGGIERTTAALRGEAESAEFLGLALSETNVKAYAESQGLVFKSLSDTEKAQLRYQLLLEQTNEIQGRAAQFAETLAGREDTLNAKLEDQSAILGEQLLPLREGYIELLTLLSDETEESSSIVSKFLAALAANFVALGATATVVVLQTVEGLKALGSAGSNALEAIKSGKNPLEAIQGDIDRFNDAVNNSNGAISNFNQTYQDAFNQILQGWQEQREQAKKTNDDLANLPFIIGGDDDPIVDTEELEKALDKLNDLERDALRERIDILRKANQKQIDTEEDFYQNRLKQATKFLREIDDIERKNAQAIEDSGTDLRRDEEDALKDYNRKRVDLEKDSAKERIKVEEDYRDEVRKIQQNFEDNAEEAARNRDAVTFFRLQRDRDRQIQEAKTTRDKRVEETAKEAIDKREELKLGLERQLEDNRIADNRRLEDLAIRLDRELEEARLKNERELQDILLAEDRKRQELKTSLDRQLEDARIANERRVSDFKASLDEEIKAQLEAEQKKTQILKDQISKRKELDRQLESGTAALEESGRTVRLGGRQFGGGVGAGQTVTVGERGPEIFRPSVAGNIIPLSPGITSPMQANNIASTINNVTNASVNQSMLDPSQQSAMMRAIAANVAVETVRKIISG